MTRDRTSTIPRCRLATRSPGTACMFKLVVAYDGTNFHGWQRQPVHRTVQGVLEEALQSVLDERVRIHGAGRTDAGVHARGQTASFQSATRLPARALPPLLNPSLPPDLRVREASEVPVDFHARRSALSRRYSYHLLGEEDVLLERYAWNPGRAFDLDRIARATRALEGEDDFTAFMRTGSSKTATVCRVFRASWRSDGCMARLDIVAD